MLPVLVPLDPGVGGSENQAGDDEVDGELAPEVCKLMLVSARCAVLACEGQCSRRCLEGREYQQWLRREP